MLPADIYAILPKRERVQGRRSRDFQKPALLARAKALVMVFLGKDRQQRPIAAGKLGVVRGLGH